MDHLIPFQDLYFLLKHGRIFQFVGALDLQHSAAKIQTEDLTLEMKSGNELSILGFANVFSSQLKKLEATRKCLGLNLNFAFGFSPSPY